jgi:hypothetical protein
MNNLRVTALLWIAILGSLQAPGNKGAEKTHAAGDANQTSATANPQQNSASPLDQKTAAPGQRAESSTDKAKTERSSDDIEIQRQLAKYTKNLVWVGIGQAVVLALTLIVIWRQATLMKAHAEHLKSLAAAAGSSTAAASGQLEAMKGQLRQMESSGKQIDELVRHAAAQVAALADGAHAAKENAEAAAANARAAKASADAFIHSQRPWLSVNAAIAGPIVFDRDHARVYFPFAITVRNVGQIPAMGVWINAVIFLPSPKKHDVGEERRNVCENLRGTTKLGQTIFPGVEPATYHITVVTPMSDIEESCRAIFGEVADDANMFVPYVIVVAAYRIGIDKDAFYYTANTYELMRREGNVRHLALKRETTPMEDLQLFLYPMSGIIAE